MYLKTKANKNKLELYKICIIANQIELISLIIDVACKWASGSCTFLYLALRHGIVHVLETTLNEWIKCLHWKWNKKLE